MWGRALTFLKHHEVHDHSSYHLLSIYCVPATILGNLQVSVDLIFKATSRDVNIPIIQMKKLRLRTIHSLARDHPASKVLNQWFHFQIPWWMVDTQVCYLPMKKMTFENKFHILVFGGRKEGPTCLSTFTNFPIMLWSSVSDVDGLAT